MSASRFKVGDRVMTVSAFLETAYFGEVIGVSSQWANVLWEDDGTVTNESTALLSHAPKKPVKMVRVGWRCRDQHVKGGWHYTSDPALLNRWREWENEADVKFTIEPIYTKKKSK